MILQVLPRIIAQSLLTMRGALSFVVQFVHILIKELVNLKVVLQDSVKKFIALDQISFYVVEGCVLKAILEEEFVP